MRGSVRRAGWARGHPARTPYRQGGHPGRKGLAGSHQGRGASPGVRGGAERGATTKLGPQGLGVHPIKSNFHPFVSAMSQIYRYRSPLPTLHYKHHPGRWREGRCRLLTSSRARSHWNRARQLGETPKGGDSKVPMSCDLLHDVVRGLPASARGAGLKRQGGVGWGSAECCWGRPPPPVVIVDTSLKPGGRSPPQHPWPCPGTQVLAQACASHLHGPQGRISCLCAPPPLSLLQPHRPQA